jgi:peptide/nickel transport system permease protein
MTLYIIRRVLWMIVVVFCVIALSYAIFYLLPSGNPAVRFAGKNPSPELLKEISHRLGLDKPWYQQFGLFTWHFFTGDKYGWPGLGYTFDGGGSVRSLILARAPRTLFLVAGAAILWLFAGVGIGVISAVKRRTIVDRGAMGFALFGISTPVFWLGLMALFIVWSKLGLTGGTGYVSPVQSISGFLSHMILPWCVLAALYAAFYARMTRNSLLETLGEDYIRTARAKGLSERQVIFKHGLRASLTPIVTMFGLDVALLVGGAVITESVFNLQGLGYLAINSALQQDLPIVIGVVLLTSVAVAFANFVVDIVYAFLDPRVRYA